MKYRILTVLCEPENAEAVARLIEKVHPADSWRGESDKTRSSFRLLVGERELQGVLDGLQDQLAQLPAGRLIVENIDAVHPEPVYRAGVSEVTFLGGLSREELHAKASDGVALSLNFFIMLFLSTVVAAIGLHEGDLAAVIGAMVIAPMLQPHISFALGASLGDLSLMKKAAHINVIGLLFVLSTSYLFGVVWPNGDEVNEVLQSRSRIDWSHLALALAAGAAAVMSLISGVSSALVGVMVAVALLPPLVAAGLLAGSGNWQLAEGALCLGLANIVCINLASKAVFQLNGIRTHFRSERKQARFALAFSYGGWLLMLGAIAAIIYYEGGM